MITLDDAIPLVLEGSHFINPQTGAIHHFRGVNFSGGTKLPIGLPSHEPNGFWVDYDRQVCFVNRPVHLDAQGDWTHVDEHFNRLKEWGFTFLRFVIVWEAIEHKGPGIYDQEYIDYVVHVLTRCKRFGIRVFIDPHQDCWSRHCGGSGHPGWTLALAGLEPSRFAPTNAAIVHNTYPDPSNYPKMVWSTNYEKLSVATMFTLFWAGSVFAPKCVVNGMNVQDYLQQHYIGAMSAVAKAIHDAEGLEGVVVLGWDTMNEPGRGYIGQPDLNKFFLDTDMRKDLSPTPFEGMQLGVGLKTKVERWDVGGFGPKKSGTEVVEPFGASAWMTQEERDQADDVFGWTRDPAWTPGCIWELHGVWQSSDRKLLRPDYFYRDVRGQGRKRDPAQTYEFSQFFVPWVEGYVRQIQQIHSAGIVFIQPPVLTIPPPLPNDLKNIAYSPHFYDGLTLINKEWKNFNVDVIGLKRGKYGSGPLKYVRAVKIGEKAIRRSFVEQLGMIRDEAKEKWGDVPVVIGEIGIPYDMKGSPATASVWLKEAYRGILRPLSMCLDGSRATSTNSPGSINTTDSPQSKAMDANINALESNLLNYTLWNYVPDNVPIWGDRWNGEDLSIWQKLGAVEGSQLTTSRDSLLTATERGNTVESINARDIPAIHRPFARVVPGYAIRSSFVLTPAPVYELSFSMPADGIRGVRSKAPAEIYIPKYHFSKVVIDEFGELPPSSRPTQGKHSKIASVEFSDELDTLSEYEIDPKQDWDISTLLLEEKVLTRVTLSSGSWQRIEEGEHYWVLAWNVLADETSPRKEHSLHIDRVVVEQGGRIVSEGALLARNKPFCTIM